MQDSRPDERCADARRKTCTVAAVAEAGVVVVVIVAPRTGPFSIWSVFFYLFIVLYVYSDVLIERIRARLALAPAGRQLQDASE